MQGLYIVLGLVALYAILLFWLVTTGRLAKWNLGLMLGVVLMVRTQKGKKLIDWLAKPKRFWNAFADFGIALSLLGMLAMTVIFLWSVWFTLRPDSGVEPLGASEILVIPGVNPFVPLWYGVIALIVTLVVHEGGHGVLARANAMKLKSLGLLIAVVPIGAFVEPDELDLKVAPRRKRLRVFAAGPVVNFAFALIALAVFSSLVGAVAPKPGLHVVAVTQDGPLARAGIVGGDTITSINGQGLQDYGDYEELTRAHGAELAGNPFVLGTSDGRQVAGNFSSRWALLDDATKYNVTQAMPSFAANATAPQGGWPADVQDGREVCLGFLGADSDRLPECADALREMPALGFYPWRPDDDRELLEVLSHPWRAAPADWLLFVSLPIGEVRGTPVLSLVLPDFHEAPFNPALFWPLATVAFWIFWINLMVGLTNILPMIPLDGGHVFRDAVGGLVEKVRPSMPTDRRERMVGRIANGMSIFILVAFVLQIVGPRIVQAFA